MTGQQKDAASKGFRLLAGYIFGGNRRKQSIAMTAPVAQEPTSEKIAMTAPVTQTQTAGEWIVRFTIPSSYSLETLPEPNDARVRLRVMPPVRFVVIRFSGLARPDEVAAKTAELSAWMQRRHLRRAGPASLAQYNPPWYPLVHAEERSDDPDRTLTADPREFPFKSRTLTLAGVGRSPGGRRLLLAMFASAHDPNLAWR